MLAGDRLDTGTDGLVDGAGDVDDGGAPPVAGIGGTP
jgi:hypothetical protein